MTYSQDFRRKVLKIKSAEKLSMSDVADRFDIGVASVMRWTKKIESQTTRNKPAVKINMEALKEDIEQYPDAYLKERAARLNVSHACVWLAMKRLNITYKKNSSASKGHTRKTIYLLPEG
jgi:transposase